MVLAQLYSARYGSIFTAYMALQRALLRRYLAQGGTWQEWCERLAPVFQRRYGPAFNALAARRPADQGGVGTTLSPRAA